MAYIENLMCYILFFANFPRKKHFLVYFLSLAILAGGVLSVVGHILSISNFLVFIYYLLEFCVLLAIFHFCFRSSWEQVLYCVSAGRATQHLIYQILQLVGLGVGPVAYMIVSSWGYILGALLTYVPFCVAVYVLFAQKIGVFDFDYEKGEFHMRADLLSAVMVLVCVRITRLVKNVEDRPESAAIVGSLYAIICCLLCLIMLFKLNRQAKLTKEMEMVYMLWEEGSRQLVERKDIIELISIKCHNIQHKPEDCHLSLTNDEEKEIKSLVQIYDQTYRIGNQIPDVLLADQILLYEKSHIQLGFLGDGECLSFLTKSEIFPLFGNALGNAVEASRSLEEAKRQISIIAKHNGDLVSINVTNYYQGELRLEDDLPVTTRPDLEDFYGYGLESMRAIARKYGDRLKVKAEDNVFSLTIWLINNQTQ